MADEQLSALEIEMICHLIDESRYWQLERIQAIIDSAILATEQVQDIRLSQQEQGKETDISDLVLPFVVTFFLESPFAAIFAATLVNGIVAPLIRTSRKFAKLELEKMLMIRSRLLKEAEQLDKKAGNIIANKRGSTIPKRAITRLAESMELRKKASSLASIADNSDLTVAFTRYSEFASMLARVGGRAPEWTVAVAKGVAQSAQSKSSIPQLQSENSSGVNLLSQIFEWGMNLRLAINHHHNVGLYVVRSELIDFKETEALLAELDLNEIAGISVPRSELALIEMRNYFQLVYEAVIWSRLYEAQLAQVGDLTIPLNASGIEKLFQLLKSASDFQNLPYGKLAGISNAITDYWIKRFGELAYQSFLNKALPPAKSSAVPYKELEESRKEFIVLQYLRMIDEDWKKLKAKMKKMMAEDLTIIY
jgi:hypothetical protein